MSSWSNRRRALAGESGLKKSLESQRRAGYIAGAAVAVATFAAMMVFFAEMYPLYMSSSDDWKYFAYWRSPLPVWGNWNPTRILPELFMPACGWIAANLVMPFNGSIVESLMLTTAAVASAFIALYMTCFYDFMRQRMELAIPAALGCTVFFFLLHFAIFRIDPSGNVYMFRVSCPTRLYYYQVSNLLCCSLVLLHLSGRWGVGNVADHPIRSGAVALMVYLSLNSNLFASIILASYAGSVLVVRLVNAVRDGQGRGCEFFRANAVLLGIVALWIVVQVFEANGGRAESLAGGSIVDRTATSFVAIAKRIYHINGWVELISLAIVVGFGLCGMRKRSSIRSLRVTELTAILAGALLLCFIYLVLVVAASLPGSTSPDILFGIFFFLLLAVLAFAGVTLKACPAAGATLPLAILLVLASANTQGRTFVGPYCFGGDGDIVSAVDEDIVNQVTEASRLGASEIVVNVPKLNNGNNFPISTSQANSTKKLLYVYGLIDDEGLRVEFMPTEEKSREFGL